MKNYETDFSILFLKLGDPDEIHLKVLPVLLPEGLQDDAGKKRD